MTPTSTRLIENPSRKQNGIAYLAVLFLIAAMGVGLAVTGVVWTQAEQRAKERELLFIGDQFRRAIGFYYELTPGTAKAYPKNLDDLLEDRRYVTPQRYLRRMYRDPMTGKQEWGLVTQANGGIVGVYSLSAATPIKTAGFNNQVGTFTNAANYTDWKFIYIPTAPAQIQPAAPH